MEILNAVWGFTLFPWCNSPDTPVVQSCDRPVTDVDSFGPTEPMDWRVQFSCLCMAVYTCQTHHGTWPNTQRGRTIKDSLKNLHTTLDQYIGRDTVISLCIFNKTVSIGHIILFLSQQTLQTLSKSHQLLFGKRGVHLGLNPSLGEAKSFMFYKFFWNSENYWMWVNFQRGCRNRLVCEIISSFLIWYFICLDGVGPCSCFDISQLIH